MCVYYSNVVVDASQVLHQDLNILLMFTNTLLGSQIYDLLQSTHNLVNYFNLEFWKPLISTEPSEPELSAYSL